MVTFKLNGYEYRTNGNDVVEALDGQTWNKTHSLKVILAARRAGQQEIKKNGQFNKDRNRQIAGSH